MKTEIKARRHFGHSSVYTWEPRRRHGRDEINLCRQNIGDRKEMGTVRWVQLLTKQPSPIISRMNNVLVLYRKLLHASWLNHRNLNAEICKANMIADNG